MYKCAYMRLYETPPYMGDMSTKNDKYIQINIYDI